MLKSQANIISYYEHKQRAFVKKLKEEIKKMSEGKWVQVKNADDFWAKEMLYTYSCYPCSLHVILKNLGIFKKTNSEIEESWNEKLIQNRTDHKGLAEDGVTKDEIDEFLAHTDQIRGKVYNSPKMETQKTQAQNTANSVLNDVIERFIRAEGLAGLIIGVEHARVVYKTKSGKFIYYNPSPEIKSENVKTYTRATVNTVESDDHKFAIQIHFDNDDEILVGDIITIITP
jgi:hypothetical protein